MNRVIRCLCAGFFLFINFALFAAPSLYRRAQDLAEDDPREAEALFVQFIQQSGDAKIKRAAAHELFTLRLKQGRLKEAFFQGSSGSFRRRFLSAVEEGLKLAESAARRLVAALRRECEAAEQGDAAAIGALLDKHRYPPAAYDFSVSVLERCKVPEPLAVFPEFDAAAQQPEVRAIQLALMEIRETLAGDDIEEAAALSKAVRESVARLPEAATAWALQFDFIEARLAAKKEDFTAVKERCAAIEKKKPPRSLKYACRSLTAYALMREEQYSEAYARLVNLKIAPAEIDNRLLRLTAAVAAGEAPADKLRKFLKRRSYRECAAVLRGLAHAVLESQTANR
ncbi:MAG: hypothetical protein J0L53_10280 [Spirochaetes bacterium]|nr:hypothetical protein [Spirochaetota bacterium]